MVPERLRRRDPVLDADFGLDTGQDLSVGYRGDDLRSSPTPP